MKNGQVHSSRAYAYAYVVAFTSENWVDIISTSTRPWTSHRPLWPRPHVNISKAMWRMLRTPSGLSYRVEESWYRELSQVCHCAHVLMLILMHLRKPGFRSILSSKKILLSRIIRQAFFKLCKSYLKLIST